MKTVLDSGTVPVGGLDVDYEYGVASSPSDDFTFDVAVGWNSSVIWVYDSDLNLIRSKSWSEFPDYLTSKISKLNTLRDQAFAPDYGPYPLSNVCLNATSDFDASISGSTVSIDFDYNVIGTAFSEYRPSPYNNYEFKELSYSHSDSNDIDLIQAALAVAAVVCLAFIIYLLVTGAVSAAVLATAIEVCYAAM